MPCAFGTKWKSGLEPACDRYDLVDCPNGNQTYILSTLFINVQLI